MQNDTCPTCVTHERHVAMAKIARGEYRKDGDEDLPSDKMIFSVDMQNIVMLPRFLGLEIALFTKRLLTFHETFAPLGKLKKPIGVIWTE